MPTWMDISDPSPGRLKAALEFILEGRSVDCHGIGLSVSSDASLQIYVPYSGIGGTRDDATAQRDLVRAEDVIADLFARAPEFAGALGSLPRKYSLIHSDGMADVELAWFPAGKLVWL